MSHRRNYLPNPNAKPTHYEIMKWRSHAEKLNRLHTAQVVALTHAVKTGRAGTSSYEQARKAFMAYTASLPFTARWRARIEVAYARLTGSAKTESYRPAPLKVAA